MTCQLYISRNISNAREIMRSNCVVGRLLIMKLVFKDRLK